MDILNINEDIDELSVLDARKHINELVAGGLNCPCCEQYVRSYRRQITSTAARSLINLYRIGLGFHHTKDITRQTIGGADFTKLRFFGLIKEATHDPDDTTRRSSGYWRLTTHGALFCELKTATNKYITIYNNEPRHFSEERITIIDALKNKFDYGELMSR